MPKFRKGNLVNIFVNSSTSTFCSVVFRKIISLLVYKHKFKFCNDIYLASGSQIGGTKLIEIDKLSAGRDFRLEAIVSYFGEKYSPSIKIGHFVSFGNNCHLAAVKGLQIGNNCLFGSNIYITDHDHEGYNNVLSSSPYVSPATRQLSSSAIFIGDNIFFGENSIILKGITIGIGARTVVTKSVPSNCIVAGNPTRIIKNYCEEIKQWVGRNES